VGTLQSRAWWNPGRSFLVETSSLSPRPFRALTGNTKREVRQKLISAKRAKLLGTNNSKSEKRLEGKKIIRKFLRS